MAFELDRDGPRYIVGGLKVASGAAVHDESRLAGFVCKENGTTGQESLVGRILFHWHIEFRNLPADLRDKSHWEIQQGSASAAVSFQESCNVADAWLKFGIS